MGGVTLTKIENEVDAKDGEYLAVHEDVVKRVLENQPAEEYLYDLAEL